MSKLKDCPYCGEKSEIFARADGVAWVIKCEVCPAMMLGRREEEPRYVHHDQRVGLMAEWNKRHDK